MINFKQFLNEHYSFKKFRYLLNEGNFNYNDFLKNDFKYVKLLINDISKGKLIQFIDGTLEQLNDDDINILNNMMKLSPNDAITYLKNNKLSNNKKWTEIEKTIYSGINKGKNSHAAAMTKIAEIMTMLSGKLYNINQLIDFKNDDEKIIKNKLLNVLDVGSCNKLISDLLKYNDSLIDWNDTFDNSGKLINSLIKNITSYECFRTGNDPISLNSPSKKLYDDNISRLMKMVGIQKTDLLNPADIVFLKHGSLVCKIMNSKLNSYDNSEGLSREALLNDWKLFWYRLYKSKLLYPISLKKLDGSGHIDFYNDLTKDQEKEADKIAVNIKPNEILLNFTFKEITSNFSLKKTDPLKNINESTLKLFKNNYLFEESEKDVIYVFQSRKASGGLYGSIACDSFINGSSAQLGKLKTFANKMCPELSKSVNSRFGKGDLSKVDDEMINNWNIKLNNLKNLQGFKFRLNGDFTDVKDMYNYAMNGTPDDKGRFVIYMQTLDYFNGVLCATDDMTKNFTTIINAALKMNDDVSFYIKIS